MECSHRASPNCRRAACQGEPRPVPKPPPRPVVVKSSPWGSPVSEGEKEVRALVRGLLPDVEVLANFRPSWLVHTKGMSLELDIWVPSLKLAIEYNGSQHYLITQPWERKPVHAQNSRDRWKYAECYKRGVHLHLVTWAMLKKDLEPRLQDWITAAAQGDAPVKVTPRAIEKRYKGPQRGPDPAALRAAKLALAVPHVLTPYEQERLGRPASLASAARKDAAWRRRQARKAARRRPGPRVPPPLGSRERKAFDQLYGSP